MRQLFVLGAALLAAGGAAAQTPTPSSSAPQPAPASASAVVASPAADPADVRSVDAIIAALYSVISGEAGQARDWDRFRSLFLPSAVMGGVFQTPEGRTLARGMTPERYIQSNTPHFAQNGFFESEIGRREARSGPLIQVFSAYAARHKAEDAEPFMRGVNALQLLDDGQRVWIASIVWSAETPDNPIPADLIARR